MSPRGYMLLGAFAGIVSAAFSFSSAGFNPVLIFAAGALFGKGYGVWEERGRAALREEKGE